MTASDFPLWQASGHAANLAENWAQQLLPFWQSMTSGVLTSSDGLKLSYHYHQSPNARHAVVISAGRMEMAVKYAELCFELVSAGYSVFLLDHRGQGLSQRELGNPHKGYVADFALYQQDLAQFIQHIVLPTGHSSHIALAHSMGCAILAGYLQQQPHPFKAAILASPMLGIYTGLVPARLAEPLALAFGAVNRALKAPPWYFPGQGNYQEKAFANNPLTSCAERYQWLHQLYRTYPDTRLGGVTTAWVDAAIKAMRRLQQDATKWHTPVLMLQASEDKVVSNYAQQLWYQQLPENLYRGRVVLKQARHEIFMETDSIRQQAFAAINDFLAQLPD
ncbi:alpha/beta fold hydrolase [Rheinheimera oceanensis]|uniref:alpha/beta fold hydrolase n=1 Tax=Rheinheimera oceanensis TaxID=2817449 RepID=UPI001BFE942B|nr:alpha/beta fold hydrolase [Rheinheimera oceanensis]